MILRRRHSNGKSAVDSGELSTDSAKCGRRKARVGRTLLSAAFHFPGGAEPVLRGAGAPATARKNAELIDPNSALGGREQRSAMAQGNSHTGAGCQRTTPSGIEPAGLEEAAALLFRSKAFTREEWHWGCRLLNKRGRALLVTLIFQRSEKLHTILQRYANAALKCSYAV